MQTKPTKAQATVRESGSHAPQGGPSRAASSQKAYAYNIQQSTLLPTSHHHQKQTQQSRQKAKPKNWHPVLRSSTLPDCCGHGTPAVVRPIWRVALHGIGDQAATTSAPVASSGVWEALPRMTQTSKAVVKQAPTNIPNQSHL